MPAQSTNFSGVLVRDQIKASSIICDPDGQQLPDKCFQPSSYDLRLGREYAIPMEGKTPDIKYCNEGEKIEIPPFGCRIISSHETLKIPHNVIGKFDLRVRQAVSGLIVQMGTQIEPAYEGRVYALLQNVTKNSIWLTPLKFEDRPFTAEFHYTAAPITAADAKAAARKSNQSLEQFIGDRALSPTLDVIVPLIGHQVDGLRQEVRQIKPWLIAAYTLFASVLASAIVPTILAFIQAHVPVVPESVKIAADRASALAEQADKRAGTLGDLADKQFGFAKEWVKDAKDAANSAESKVDALHKTVFDLQRNLLEQRQYISTLEQEVSRQKALFAAIAPANRSNSRRMKEASSTVKSGQ